jgi:hypothetical protein
VVLRLLDCLDDVLIQPFMPDSSIVTFDVRILLGFAWLDMHEDDVSFSGPRQ